MKSTIFGRESLLLDTRSGLQTSGKPNHLFPNTRRRCGELHHRTSTAGLLNHPDYACIAEAGEHPRNRIDGLGV